MQTFTTDIQTAQLLDQQDVLANYKQRFHFPTIKEKNSIYFCGNSLGLQPKNAEAAMLQELTDWKNLAIGGFSNAKKPWLYYQEYLNKSLCKLVGAKETEVTVMNTLTVNLHLQLLTFYKPTQQRYKIMMEAGAFPSDQYAIETLVKHFNLHPETTILEIKPRPNEKILHTQDILNAIYEHGESLAMIMFGGINYYTGQLFNIEELTKAAHAVGAIAGFDLAHVVGNVPVQLHQWNVDFACWCSYKYLNGGPGAVGGIFIHEKYATNANTPRLAGWWGNNEKERFKMEKGFVPKLNASGWNISTAQVLNTVCLKASLEIFDEVGIETIRTKSVQLTAYLAFLLNQLTNLSFEIITPKNVEERGAQLCLFFNANGKAIHQKMMDNGIIVDYREPGVIRIAPAPLYCSYEDVYKFYQILQTFEV